MLIDYYYKVAEFIFEVSLPEEQDIHSLLPSFVPFYQGIDVHAGKDDILFHFTACDVPVSDGCKVRILDDAENDMGHVRLSEYGDNYIVELNYMSDTPIHTLCADRTFRLARVNMLWNDPYVGHALSSMLRIVYSLSVPFRGGISLHAAAVVLNGNAYLFMGKGGTGKSTHAALWLRHFPECTLLNDDNPTVRAEGGKVTVYGTPWSGKTPCYKNRQCLLAGIVRLRQSGENSFVSCTDVDAFITLLPGCSAIRNNKEMCDCMYDTLTEIITSVRIGKLECRPDEAAVRLCAASLAADEKDGTDTGKR